MFTAYELREMELAESVVPYGERAQTLRTLFLGYRLFAAQGDKDAAKEAGRIAKMLLGE